MPPYQIGQLIMQPLEQFARTFRHSTRWAPEGFLASPKRLRKTFQRSTHLKRVATIKSLGNRHRAGASAALRPILSKLMHSYTTPCTALILARGLRDQHYFPTTNQPCSSESCGGRALSATSMLFPFIHTLSGHRKI